MTIDAAIGAFLLVGSVGWVLYERYLHPAWRKDRRMPEFTAASHKSHSFASVHFSSMPNTQSATVGLLLLSLFLLATEPAVAQPLHGEIVEVSDQTLRVELVDTLTVAEGTEGQVVLTRTVGGEQVEMNVARITAEQVERPESGPWIAVCRVEQQSEPPVAGDAVRFEEVRPRPGHLIVRDEPSATMVYIDGERAGTIPVRANVSAGTHKVRLERDGFSTHRETISVPPGGEQVIEKTLSPLTGILAVPTPEGATVRVGDRVVGTVPVRTRLQPGDYEVQVRQEGYLTVRRSVTVEEGQKTQISPTLRRSLQVRPASQQDEEIANVQVVRREEQLVIISYALNGKEDTEYEVELRASNENGRSFDIQPESTIGDVGEGIRPGKQKRIVWQTDVPERLQEGEYVFRVVARGQSTDTFGDRLAFGLLVGHAPPAATSGGGLLLRYNIKNSPVRLRSSLHFYHRDSVGDIFGGSVDAMFKYSFMQIGLGTRVDKYNIGEYSGSPIERDFVDVLDVNLGLMVENREYIFFIQPRMSVISYFPSLDFSFSTIRHNNMIEIGVIL